MDTAQKFPDFKLQNQDGQWRTLKDYENGWLVLYVYPKDDTPGCTVQGKSFTATKDQFENLKTQVVGLSADDVASHKDFCNKFSFTIELLADPEAQLLSQLNIGQKEFKGQSYWNRTTFIIDPEGVVRKIYPNVNPEGHEQTLLQDLKTLQSSL